MARLVFRRRSAAALVSLAVLIGAYLGFVDRANHAQELKPEPAKARFESFARADEVTGAIRDRSKEIARIVFHSISDREKIGRYGRVVSDFGSSVVVVKDKNVDLGRAGFDAHRIATTVNLPGKSFEPVDNPPSETVRPGEHGRSGRGYYVVQFGGLVNDDWLDSIRDAGVDVLQYIPHQAFFVYGEREAIAKIAGHSRVRWVGEYTADQKLSPHVTEFARASERETASFDVAVFSRADLRQVAGLVGGRLLAESKLPNNFFNVLRVELTTSELERVAAIPDVFRIDPYIRPAAEDERAAQIVSGNYSNVTTLNAPGYNPLAQFGVDGTGVTVMVSDDGISIPGNGGFYITAANTVDGPLRGATAGASGGHGHINASIIAGNAPFGILDPLGYNYGLGVAPKANIINIPFLKSGNTTTDAQAVDDAIATVGPNGSRGSISNNSWGAGTNGNSYGSLEAQYDGLVQDGSLAATIDPFSIIFSAGNSGPGANSLTRPKVSKNTIAVANTENIRPEFTGAGADNMDDLRSNSSRGPAADGRIKPDIAAPGTVITGSRAGTSCGSVSSCFDANHSYSTGTSHAAPQVAGAAALFTEYWRNNHTGAYPSPSLIKASILNTGQEMNGATTSTFPVPNGIEGWGRVNLKMMLNAVPTLRLNEEHVFSNPGTAVAFLGSVADSTKPVRVTLVWTDPPGAGDPALVNNLDLQVNVGGNFYRGNVLVNGTSTTGGSPDTVNNVEMVLLPAGIPAGTFFSVAVSAVALNGDGVLGNADTTDQHFSVVAHNFQSPSIDPRPIFDFDGDDKTDISIFRPSNFEWWINRSSDSTVWAGTFGAVTEAGTPVPADFTGDGRTDIAVRRSNGDWFVLRSENFTYYSFPFGFGSDIPVVGYFNNDNKADVAVFRSESSFWFVQYTDGGSDLFQFGTDGDRPTIGDYDGDGVSDVGIFRPSNGQWWLRRSSGGVIAYAFGLGTDKTVQGDYTGDGRTDVAFWRPGTGEWFVLRSEDLTYYAVPFGASTDLPVPGDYDGDGAADRAVFRPSTATWYVDRSSAGILIQNFGLGSDVPVPNVVVR